MQNDIKKRTKRLAVEVIRLVEGLPKTRATDVIGKQLLRSATSVAANYRSACRAKSKPDFISKMGIVEEEADESLFWFELLIESGLINEERIKPVLKEIDEIIAITVSSIKTAKENVRFRNQQSAFRNCG